MKNTLIWPLPYCEVNGVFVALLLRLQALWWLSRRTLEWPLCPQPLQDKDEDKPFVISYKKCRRYQPLLTHVSRQAEGDF